MSSQNIYYSEPQLDGSCTLTEKLSQFHDLSRQDTDAMGRIEKNPQDFHRTLEEIFSVSSCNVS